MNCLMKKKNNSGRKPKYNRENVVQQISAVPQPRRQTYRCLQNETGIPMSTLHLMAKKKWFYQKLSTVKPVLKYHHKINRLKFALSFVKTNFQFDKMYEYVHIDEKWFYLTKIKNKYFLVPGEDIPNRQVCNKRFITKVMFMAAVARPRYDYNKKAMFDGKIGIWPFIYKDTAKRTTHKQKKGDLITKIIPKINRDVVRKMLIDNVLPAIKSK